jgi:hypothetical protein
VKGEKNFYLRIVVRQNVLELGTINEIKTYTIKNNNLRFSPNEKSHRINIARRGEA